MGDHAQITRQTTEMITVHSEQVTDKIYVFKRDVMEIVTSSRGASLKKTENSAQGLTSRAGIQKILAGEPIPSRPFKNSIMVFDDEKREIFRTNIYGDAMVKAGIKKELADCYILFKEGKWSASDLCEIDISSHTLRDATGEVLPLAVYVDYNSGLDTHDGKWNLRVLKDHLATRGDVKFLNSANKFIEASDRVIQSIPHYNQDENEKEFISFLWQPSKEDYLKVWNQAAEFEPEYPDRSIQRAMFYSDILGIRAAGANRYETYGATSSY